MTRNRASAKAAGSRFERIIADYLNDHLDEPIDRRVQTGAKDKGDIGGVLLPHRECDGGLCNCGSRRVVLECKDVTKLALGPWVKEADTERINDGALVGLVVHKRRGTADPGDQYVTATLRDLVALLTGARP